MILLLFHYAYSLIPKEFAPLAKKALESVKYRKLMTEKKINMLQPGSYETEGIKFKLSKTLFGPPAKEIKGHAYENNYLAIVPNKKYNSSKNFTNSAFALDQKMYLLRSIKASDESVAIYNVTEIDVHYIITEIIMYTTNENSKTNKSCATISSSLNFNWDEKENTPVFRTIIPSFSNVKFGLGTKIKASASARLHSRGTSYLQLDMILKIEGSFGAGIRTIAGQNFINDAALYGKDSQIWGQSLKLFGFEFKSGLFAYIDASIVDVSLNTAIDFTFMQGYNFEAYNKIVVCTGFPSPGYTTTGWQSKAEKIDIVNKATQNGPQDTYVTSLSFTPRVDIGIKLGLEMPGSTSSWLKAGIRGEINFNFGADPVMCDFPYLIGKVEPVISLFVGYDGLKILGFEVAPSFEKTWELYKKTIFDRECAFLDVKVSPEFITVKKFKIGQYPLIQIVDFKSKDDYDSIPLYSPMTDEKHYISVWKKNETNFKPIFFDYSSAHDKNYPFYFNSLFYWENKTSYLTDKVDGVKFTNESGLINVEGNTFKAKYSYKNIQKFFDSCLLFDDKGEFAVRVDGVSRYALIYADLKGGFTVAKSNDVEFWDCGTPNEGVEKIGIPSSFLHYGKYCYFFNVKTYDDFGKIKIDVFVTYKHSSNLVYYETIYHSGKGVSKTNLLIKEMNDDVEYIYNLYINDTYVQNKTYSSKYLNSQTIFELFRNIFIERKYKTADSVYVKIKNDEIIGKKRFALIPITEVSLNLDLYYPQNSPFYVSIKTNYFLLKLNLFSRKGFDPGFKPEEIENLTNFAMLLKCPQCFPICKNCETIDEGYYIIKLTLNDTLFLTDEDQCIMIPMCTLRDKLFTEFCIVHFITLNNEGSSQCKNNTVLRKEKMGQFHGTWFKYACITQSSERETWNASYYNKNISGVYKYHTFYITEIRNRDQVLVVFDDWDKKFNNYDILISKEFINYPRNTSHYKRIDTPTLFMTNRCTSVVAQIGNKSIVLGYNFNINKHIYKPVNPTYEEIDFVCFCRNKDDTNCVNSFYHYKDGYYLFESKSAEGITITQSISENHPRGKIKREVVKMNHPSFFYTKTWEGELVYYLLNEEPNSYQITVEISAPKENPEFRKIQLFMNGDKFNKYPIGFDVFRYMDDPLAFLAEIDLDKEMKPGWVHFGNDSELFVIIDIEPIFNRVWCSKAAKLSPIPANALNPEFKVQCGKGMKSKKNTCVVNNFGWKFWTIIAASIVGTITIIVLIVVLIKKIC
ncbi:hypothetical protein M9Y10_025069 [Tritrichomonas musculus]|uniref:Uncharacterized protein n=1 Tax=Tritrichomonas musculus TaxID=1915356 RepID=A0ABR2HCB7_9EUKA